MRIPLFIASLIYFSTITYAQEITGGPLSPDLTKISPNTLVELVYKDKNNGVDWIIYTTKINIDSSINIITINNYIDSTNQHCIFTGVPGNYLVNCNIITIDPTTNKPVITHLTTIISIKTGEQVTKLFVAIVSNSPNDIDVNKLQSTYPNFIFKKYLHSRFSSATFRRYLCP